MSVYKFRSNSDLCLTGDLRQMPPGVIAYGIQFDLNLYLSVYGCGLSNIILLYGDSIKLYIWYYVE